MVNLSKGKVGSKGELFPPKKIRSLIGLVPGQNILYRVVKGRLIVEKLLTAEELLKKTSKVIMTVDELKKDRLKLSEDASK